MQTFTGNNVNSVYAQSYFACLGGNRVPSRNGDTMELNPGIFDISNPRERLVTCFGRPVNVAFALAEVLWILQGRRDVEMLKFYNSAIDQWSDDGLSFNAPYGYRLREAHGFDQINDVIRTLRADPGSRQAILNVWHPWSDRGWVSQDPPQYAEGFEGDPEAEMQIPHVTADRACNAFCTMKIRDGKLNWMQVVRSNDLIWGVPYNFMQWTHVQEYIARKVGVEVGNYVHVADSLHVYDFNKPKNVKLFDLYEALNDGHEKMQVENMEVVFRLEEEIRTSDLDDNVLYDHILDQRHEDQIGMYWVSVLMILLAHRAYKEKRDRDCFDMLDRNPDSIYSLSQAKFYWMNRWKKGESEVGLAALSDLVVDALPLPLPGGASRSVAAAEGILGWLQDDLA